MIIRLYLILIFTFNFLTSKMAAKRRAAATTHLLRDLGVNIDFRGTWELTYQGQGIQRDLRALRSNPQAMEKKPRQGPNYDPNTGYEPYWQNGSWVYVTVPKDRTDSDYSCGVKCIGIYTVYGKLCAQNRFNNYKSFNSYCHMKSEDCIGYLGWKVAYKGKCYGSYNKKNLTDFLRKKVTPFKYSKDDIERFNS